MSASESFTLASNETGASLVPTVSVIGGKYKVQASGTLGTTPLLQVEDHAGNWIKVAALAAGAADVWLPPGLVRANLGSDASAAYVFITRIPFAM